MRRRASKRRAWQMRRRWQFAAGVGRACRQYSPETDPQAGLSSAGGLAIGGAALSDVRIGDTPVQAVYVGDQLVWERNT